MSRIVLVEDIFGLVPVARTEKGCWCPSSPSYLTPQRRVFWHVPAVPLHYEVSAFACQVTNGSYEFAELAQYGYKSHTLQTLVPL